MVGDLTPLEALELAIERAGGSQSALARKVGVSPTAVWKWVQSSKRVPPNHVLAVEAATGVSRHDLNPDMYPRHLVDGVPYIAVAEHLDDPCPFVPSNRAAAFDGRDRHAGTAERFYGAAR